MNESRRFTGWPYVLPFGIFLIGLALVQGVKAMHGAGLFFVHPEFWIYPVQTVACAVAVLIFWKRYEFRFSTGIFWAVAGGLLALAIWISPQWLFGVAHRNEGFNPEILGFRPEYYWWSVGMRFLRLAVAVPFVEEIFWRGFLMRYLINDRFEEVPFGTYRLFPFVAVAVMFALEHTKDDWIPGVLTGLIYNGLAVRTRSLGACVIAHAITNLGLGWYIMSTKQWGFW